MKRPKKKYDPVKTHMNHPAEVRDGRGPHGKELYCIKCGKHIKWLSELESQIAQKMP